MAVEGQPRQIVCKTPSPKKKKKRAKQTGGEAQVVVLLFCKYEALISNSSSTKKRKLINSNQNKTKVGHQWLTPVILANSGGRNQENRSQPRQIVRKTLSQKYPSQKVAQGEG
jgi:hypothetical protein